MQCLRHAAFCGPQLFCVPHLSACLLADGLRLGVRDLRTDRRAACRATSFSSRWSCRSRPSAIIWPGAAVQIIDAAVRNIGNRRLSKAALWLCLRRYAPPPCSSPVPSTTKKSPDRMVWGCGGALSTAVEPLDEVFFKAIMIDAFLIHRTAAICCPCLDLIEGVSHGNACADCFQHFNVVSAIPKGDSFCF